jgi:hypothetical protein
MAAKRQCVRYKRGLRSIWSHSRISGQWLRLLKKCVSGRPLGHRSIPHATGIDSGAQATYKLRIDMGEDDHEGDLAGS